MSVNNQVQLSTPQIIQPTNQQIQQSIDPNNYFNMIIGAVIVQQLSNTNTKEGFTWKNMGVIVMMLSATELSSIFKLTLQDISSCVRGNFKPFFFGTFSYGYGCGVSSYKFFGKLFTRKEKLITQLNKPITDEDCGIYTNKYVTTINNDFIQGLVNFMNHNYCESDKIVISYNVDADKETTIETSDKNGIITTEKWNDIKINYKGYDITFQGNLKLKFRIHSDIKTLAMATTFVQEKMKPIIVDDPLQIRYIHQLIPDLIIRTYLENNIISCYSLTQEKDILNICIPSHPIFVDNFKHNKEKGILTFERYILKIYRYYYPNLSLTNCLLELCLLTYLYTYVGLNIHNLLIDVTSPDVYIFGISLKWDHKCEYSQIVRDHIRGIDPTKILRIQDSTSVCIPLSKYMLSNKTIIGKINSRLGHTPFEYSIKDDTTFIFQPTNNIIKFIDIKDAYNKTFNDLSEGTKETKDVSNQEITILCTKRINDEHPVNEDIKRDIDTNFQKFITTVKTFGCSHNVKNDKITIRAVKLVKKETKTSVPNPEYKKYEEEGKRFEKLNGQDNDNRDPKDQKEEKKGLSSIQKDIQYKKFAQMAIPDENIVEVVHSKEIVDEEINEDYRDFNTLYLREQDETELKSILNSFRDKKDFLLKLGIPNKLCVLLDGEPGTGKSSTVIAIATYLKKDIYYICWDNIETNNDIKMIFDYVIKKNNGIIVCEDIDAIKIFLRRKHVTISNPNSPSIGSFSEVRSEQSETQVMTSQFEKLTLDYILNLLQGTLTQDNLIAIFTTNFFNELDDALVRDCRMDLRITLMKCDHYQINRTFKTFFGRDINMDLLNNIKENEYTPANIITHFRKYLFKHVTDEEILRNLLSKDVEIEESPL